MNDCKFSGRPTKEPEIRYTQGENQMAIARYTLAVERRFKKDGGQQADFLNIVAFGKQAEFVEKYVKKGVKIIVGCTAQSGRYTDKDGKEVYYIEFVANEHEFCEKKGSEPQQEQTDADGFMNIPDGIDDTGLPFN